MNDREIVNLYWQRAETAITETERKYGSYCHTIAYNILENVEDSEECVSDTWLSAWNTMPDRRPERLSPFLGRITRNFAISKAIAKCREKRGGKSITLALEELDECIASGYSLEDEIEERELEQTINRFVNCLPEVERMVFVSRYWFLDTEVGIARKQGFSKSKVSAMLKRTRDQLRKYLIQEGLCVSRKES